MKIIIGGDIIPTEKNMTYFENNDIGALLDQELKNIWFNADFRIANLETPITDEMKKNSKYGLHVKSSPKVMNGIRGLNFSILCCANNHILDYGVKGLEDTREYLDQYGIEYVGIGESDKDFYRYKTLTKENVKVGVYCCCDHEFSVAQSDASGAIAFDCYNTMKAIKKIKKTVDKLIVIYHSGIEFYQYPSPLLQRDCRAMVEFGADIVVCQHGHCIACEEKYMGSHIIYGQGHFISNSSHDPNLLDELLIEININQGGMEVTYIPISVKKNETLALSCKQEAIRILNEFNKRSIEINEKNLQKIFDKFVETKSKNYILSLRGSTVIDRIMAKIFKQRYIEKIYSDSESLIIWNYMESRVHNEIVKRIFELRRMKIKNED